MSRKGLLERLADGVVIGDGGFVTIMEKRGYSRIGAWTPEATVEHPEAGEIFFSLKKSNTEMAKEVCPRLRDSASGRGAISRNLQGYS